MLTHISRGTESIPNCLVNSRLGLSIEEDPDIDFKTLGDNELGDKKEEFPWQSPATVANSWGFHVSDNQWKSTTTLLKSLINNVSLNGNFMLNIGPRANGDVPFEISQRMLEMGKWLEINGESIYGAGAFDLDKNQHDWGKITCKKTNSGVKLFLHIFNWPLNRQLFLTGVNDIPNKIYLLADKQKSMLDFSHSDGFTKITLPALQPDPYVSVVVVEYDKMPEITDGLVAKNNEGGFSLTPFNCVERDNLENVQTKERYGTIPEHLEITSEKTLHWKVYVDEPGEKSFDVSYFFQNDKSKTTIQIETAGQKIIHQVRSTGKTVAEANSDWAIDNYKSNKTGKILFSEKGIYDIEMKVFPGKNEKLDFQWIWVK